MKKRILSLVMTVIMLTGLLCTAVVPAFANDGGGDPAHYWGTQGSEASWFINERAGFNVNKVTSISGVLPDGMRTRVRNGKLYVSGTPTEAGTFNANIHVRATNGKRTWDDQLPVVITIEPGRHKDYSLPAYYATLKVDDYKKLSFDMDSSGSITDYLCTGSVPNGMAASMDRYGVYLKGSPTTPGTYSFTLKAYNSSYNCYVSQPVTLTVKGNSVPTITKSPTSETVDEGGRALFVARASEADSITWYINGNGTTYLASDAPYYFTGLTVSGTNGETLVLNNIPLVMNGFTVQARFTNNLGSVYSGQAKINVNSIYVAPPTIRTQPKSIIMEVGEQATLSVFATSPKDGNYVGYQWLECPDPNHNDGNQIIDADSSSLTLDYQEGERYFCCVMNCYNNRGGYSEFVYTNVVTVTGVPAPTEPKHTEPAPTEDPAAKPTTPEETVPAPTAAAPAETVPAATTAPDSTPQPAAPDHTVAYIVGGILVTAMLCCTAILITILSKGKFSK